MPDSGGNYAVTGACDSGYVCGGGAKVPKPINADVDVYVNDRIEPGFYEGSNVMTACDAGTFQDGYYQSTCKDCYHGHYCPTTGMSSIALYTCTAGYACDAEGLEEAEGDSSDTYQCQRGYYCPAGALRQLVCDSGYYTDADGESTCSSCPSGQYCENKDIPSDTTTITRQAEADYPIDCLTDQGTCTGANAVLPMCDEGKYVDDTTTPTACITCPATFYCYANKQVDNCIAGYYCGTGMSHPAEETICPEGHYCDAGTASATDCPTGTFSANVGNVQEDDCTPCPPGFVCERRSNEPTECAEGHYCIIGSNEQTECPVGTYNSLTKRIVEAECLSCPAGYYCDETALTTYKNHPCQAGYYCPQKASKEYACPAGTYRDNEGAESVEECEECPAGYYCPEATIAPIACVNGTYCPYGSIEQKICPGGYYCYDGNNYQLDDCPINYKCPRGSFEPIECTGRHICEANTEIEELCPAGTFVVDNSAYYLQNICVDCPPGQYSTLLDLAFCNPCPAGYICYGGTNRANPTDLVHHKGEKCPKGHYCPESTLYPIPCGTGRYNAVEGAESEDSCLLCPEETFQDEVGQEGCKPCGFYATSSPGSETCSCTGAYRAFSDVDSSCRCKSGYDFKDTNGVSKGSESSLEDCIPNVYDRCDGNDLTRAPDGSCKDIYDCEGPCKGGAGVRSLTLGVCTCNTTLPVESICPQSCRNNASDTSMQPDSTSIYISDADGTQREVDLADLDGTVLGDVYCPSGSCTSHAAEMGTGKMVGTYGPSNALSEAASRRLVELGKEPLSMPTFTRTKRGRSLQQSVDTAEISNPVYCITEGDLFLFTITDPEHYPVYMKDSVMNSNDDFDYGSFMELERSMKNKQALGDTSDTYFRFTFDESGTYVFNDATDSDSLMLVKVVGAGEKCYDSDKYIQPMSLDALASIGVQ